MGNSSGLVSGSVLLSEMVYYPLVLEYSASTNNSSDLGVEFLQISGPFAASECLVRSSLLYKSASSRTQYVSIAPARTCCTISELHSVDSPLSLATVGIIKSFTISLRDAFGNSVSACSEDISLVHSGGAAQSKVDCRASTAEFRPTSSGVYFVYGKLESSAGCAMPAIKIFVQPSVRSFQDSAIKGTALTLATCGQASWMTMTIRDMFSNPQPKSESPSIQCSLNGTLAIQTNLSPCPGMYCPEHVESTLGPRQFSKPEYSFNYIATLAGVFKLSIYSRGYIHILGSPFSIRILPSSVCLSNSVSSGSSLTVVTNQNAVSFVISSRDSFGNAQPNGFWVSVMESEVVKQSIAASAVLGGNFRAVNRALCGSGRCNIYSMLLKMDPIFAT